MKVSVLAGFVSAIAMLTACSGEADAPEAANDDPPALAESADAPVEVPVVQEEPVAEETPTSEQVSVTSEGAVPAVFLGVWDYVEGTCARESDMRLEITQDSLTFYESYGEVQGVRSEGDYTIVDLAMEGEGETWTSSERLFVDESGELHLTDPETENALTDYPRKRCDG